MKKRTYTQGITIFTTPEMYQAVRKASDDLNISLAELFREMVRQYFENRRDNRTEEYFDWSTQDDGK